MGWYEVVDRQCESGLKVLTPMGGQQSAVVPLHAAATFRRRRWTKQRAMTDLVHRGLSRTRSNRALLPRQGAFQTRHDVMCVGAKALDACVLGIQSESTQVYVFQCHLDPAPRGHRFPSVPQRDLIQ
jgi:hypothetical protein